MLSVLRITAAVAVMLIAAGLGCAAAAAIPFEVIQPLGRHIRRAADFTAERHARLVHVCLAFAAIAITSGCLLWIRRRSAADWLQQLRHDFTAALANAPGIARSWGCLAWGLIGLGVVLRGTHLDDSMAYDEAYTFHNLASQSLIVGIADYNSTNNHLLNTLLMHCSWRLFGDAEWALRLPVFLTGILLLPLIWIWSARWIGRPAAILVLALAAVSPLLMTYSTDARGYVMVTAAAVALDDAAARLLDPRSSRPLAWLQSVAAAALGLCAMPIMLYPLVSVAGWVMVCAALRLDDGKKVGVSGGHVSSKNARFRQAADELARTVKVHRWPIAAGLLACCLIVGAMYSPAYIFRGRSAMHDQVLKPVLLAGQAAAQWRSLLGAWEWWTTGFPPQWAWLIGLVLGVLRFRSAGMDRVRWLALPAAMLMLNVVGRVAPPPRVYIVLWPSIALLAAAGWIAGTPGRGRHSRLAGIILALCVAVGGTAYAMTHPVLIFPQERASFRSVRDAMLDLQSRIAADGPGPHRLIAPLPCDLPAIFYRDREGIAVEINGMPREDEVLWLLAREGETPGDVLKTPLINLPEVATQRADFEQVARFKTLFLFRSRAAR